MEKFSKWRDPATGIQPFLPPIPSSGTSPIFIALLMPFSAAHALVRSLLLGAVALVHLLLVEGVCFVLAPLPRLHRVISSFFTAVTCRLALFLMGYWWITAEMVSPKRGNQGVAQISNRSPRRGDLIISNWTSYVDVLYLAFRYNPTFLLPVFAPSPEAAKASTGRHTGTGSAQLAVTLPQPPLLGYIPVSLPSLLSRTGGLPTTHNTAPRGMYKTLRDARRREKGPVVLFPEGTTGNGRAVLRFPEGTIGEADMGGDDEGIVWIKFFRHSTPTAFAASATCPLPAPLNHLLLSLLWTPTPLQRRSLTVRTLHPSASPSSPSFLPTEILSSAPGGLEGLGKDGKGAWREAVATVLAETGRVRRVKQMGWVEKGTFLEFWRNNQRR